MRERFIAIKMQVLKSEVNDSPFPRFSLSLFVFIIGPLYARDREIYSQCRHGGIKPNILSWNFALASLVLQEKKKSFKG